MSFRDNLQHLRATRNMTQEQLAMLLGVSRQSVTKWEAERSYPEMDKLLTLCDLFDCTLDELVLGDITDRPLDKASSIPTTKVPQDVTGYDEVMSNFAWKFALGVAIVILGASLALLLSGNRIIEGSSFQSYASALVFVGIAAGLAIILPALFVRGGFRKAHPFVEDFYTSAEKNEARTSFLTGLVAGIALIMLGLAAVIVLQGNVWLASSAFLATLAVGSFLIIRGYLLWARCNLAKYNQISLYKMNEDQIDALDDEKLQASTRRAKRERSSYVIVMCLATIVGLVLLFVPALDAQWWFWLAWPIGGIVCLVIRAFRTMQSKK